jgi:hypothetical protein
MSNFFFPYSKIRRTPDGLDKQPCFVNGILDLIPSTAPDSPDLQFPDCQMEFIDRFQQVAGLQKSLVPNHEMELRFDATNPGVV